MKFLVALVVLAAVASARNIEENLAKDYTAYGYLTKVGVPLADKIRKAEEASAISAPRIVGGQFANDGQIPHQAGLLIDIIGFEDGRQGVCGGSLVSANRVITAAHCWFDGQNQAWRMTVVLGSTRLFSGGTRLATSAVFTHHNWMPQLIRNDVGVIYLPSSVATSAFIRPIALPTGNELAESFAGDIGVASGFGLTEDLNNGGAISADQRLSYVSLTIISNSACALGIPIVQSSNICTRGFGGVGTCSGDSGGPLTVVRNGREVLVGITSFGTVFGCEIFLPAVYARVTSFMDFFNLHV